MLTLHFIGEFNPFDHIKCPLCNCDKFTSISLTSVWCNDCNTRFSVEHTSGDAGCVVRASFEAAWEKYYECIPCGTSQDYDKGETCLRCQDKLAISWRDILGRQDKPDMYIILTGDSSSWIESTTHSFAKHIGSDRQAEYQNFKITRLYLPGHYDVAKILKKLAQTITPHLLKA